MDIIGKIRAIVSKRNDKTEARSIFHGESEEKESDSSNGNDYACSILDCTKPENPTKLGLPGIHRNIDLVLDSRIKIQRLPFDEKSRKQSIGKIKKLIALNKSILVERIRIAHKDSDSIWWYEDSEWKEKANEAPSILFLPSVIASILAARKELDPRDRSIYPIPCYGEDEKTPSGILLVVCTEDMIIAILNESLSKLGTMAIATAGNALDESIGTEGLERASERHPALIMDIRNSSLIINSGMTPEIDRSDEDLLASAIYDIPEGEIFLPGEIKKKDFKENALPVVLKWGSVTLLLLVGVVVLMHYISQAEEENQLSKVKIQQLNQNIQKNQKAITERQILDAYISHPPDLGFLYRNLYMDSLVLKKRAFDISVQENSVIWRLSGTPIIRTEFVQAKKFLEHSLNRDGGPEKILIEPNSDMTHSLVMEGHVNVQ